MQKLVLFDIDGTLVRGSGTTIGHWQQRVRKTVGDAFGVDVPFTPRAKEYNGWPDMQVLWDVARRVGVSEKEFEHKVPWMRETFYGHLKHSLAHGVSYVSIATGVQFLKLLIAQAVHDIGLITGNVEPNAFLKLENAGITHPFVFGLYGDVPGDRNELAGRVFGKAKAHFGRIFEPSEIVVIGDTIHDVRAGKSIGAVTIAVTTGHTDGRDSLAKENPDILVDSLMEWAVRDFFGV